ncbi:MAG: pseudouridine synthase [Desulfobacterales bacterium]|nr:MAG: pseudouridine synthase [Desulfobacterales bacterium]
MRLQKFLAHAGVCSRRHAEELIVQGKVQVNGQKILTLGTKVDAEKDQVQVNGRSIHLQKSPAFTYIMVNKPRGVITTCSQPQNRGKIILDLVPMKKRLYPVGRLDKDSHGLVLLTDDGKLHHLLSHPSFDHEKEYRVTTVFPISDQDLATMAKGMIIDGEKTRKAFVTRKGKNEFIIVLKQGKNRQIRKMVGKTGNRVKDLYRVRMANLFLGSLASGHWRHLTPMEIQGLEKVKQKTKFKNKLPEKKHAHY